MLQFSSALFTNASAQEFSSSGGRVRGITKCARMVIARMVISCMAIDRTRTRGVEAFLKKTAIAYHQNSAFLLVFGRYAIAVFLKNDSTSRV